MPFTRRQAMAMPLAFGIGPSSMPRVPFGSHQISRLIVGGNPISGNSHVSGEMSREMLDYFTSAKVLDLLRDCESAGINTWQSRGDRHIRRLLHEHRLEGGKLQWIAQTASEYADIPRHIRTVAADGAIGIYHHGSRTDSYWKAGKIGEAREMLKVIRDAGVRVGLGTHIPEVIDHIESEDWDLDFYMTCLYNLSRTPEEAQRLTGQPHATDLFLESDREAMLSRVRQTRKQCLIFKVYGASRACSSREKMLGALEQAARSAKPSDCVVIGMFPKHGEQVRENCELLCDAFSRTT